MVQEEQEVSQVMQPRLIRRVSRGVVGVALVVLALAGLLANVSVGVVSLKRMTSTATCADFMQWTETSIALVQDLAPAAAQGRVSIEQNCEGWLFAEGTVGFAFHVDNLQAACDEIGANFTRTFGEGWEAWEDRGTPEFVCAAGLENGDAGGLPGDVEYYVEADGRAEVLVARYAVLGD